MNMFENNAFFWQKLDALFFSSKLVIHYPKNTHHEKYINLVYPVDYGYLTDTSKQEEKPIAAFKGSLSSHFISSIIVSADILNKDCAVKLLIGCTPEEERDILFFLNQTEFQKTILMRRGNEVPDWAQND